MSKEFDPKDFQIGKNYVIDASAGTGKTHNIVGIVKSLIQGGIGLDKLLIVTYTDKAAGELKNRIREEMNKSGLLVDVDNSSIGTIHSFCKNIIKEYFISSGKSSNLSLIDEGEASDFIQRYIRSDAVYNNLCQIKLQKIDNDIESGLLKTFTALIESYYLNSEWKEEPGIAALDPEICDKINRWKTKIVGKSAYDFYPELRADLEVLKNSSYSSLNHLYDVISDKIINENSLSWKCQATGVKTKMNPDELASKDRLVAAKKEYESIDINPKVFPFIYIEDLYRKWQQEKENNNQQTFNDMLRIVREEVVSGNQLLDAIRAKYKYAIIDEFQDTNQKQWDIFKKAFMCDDHNIIVVGDPKQSIYSFQGADLTVYNKAIAEIIANGGEERELTKNYRATKEIIDNTNWFFDNKEALSGFTDNPATEVFPKSGCGNTNFNVAYEGKHIEAFQICDVSSSNAEEYSKVVAQTIVDYCSYKEDNNTKLRVTDKDGKERNVCFNDFAILARTRSEMDPITSELERCGIPYTKYKDNALFTGHECAVWIALFDAIDSLNFSGKNRNKYRKAMITDFFGYSVQEIRSPYFDKDDTAEIRLFEKWKSLAAESKWEDLIDSIILDTELKAKLSSLKDIKRLGVLLQIGDYCIDYLSEGHNIQSLIKNLKKSMDKNNDEQASENAGIVAKATDFNCVKVMTIHASKGLEFPVVISASGFKNPIPNSGWYPYHESGKYILTNNKNEQYTNENVREWQRLFYVAYTRAKYILILPKYHELNDAYSFVSKSIANYMANYNGQYKKLSDNTKTRDEMKDMVKDILAKLTGSSSSGSAGTEADQLKKLGDIIRGKSSRMSYKHAYSSLSHSKEKEDVISGDETRVDNSEDVIEHKLDEYDRNAVAIPCAYNPAASPDALSADYPAGAGLGNALHDIFESIDYKKENCKNLHEFISVCFKKQGFDPKPNWIDDTDRMIDNVTGAILPLIHGCNTENGAIQLKDIPFSDRRNEIEFNFNKEGQSLKNYFNGFIDLVFRRGDYYSILDWKSDRLDETFTSYSNGDDIKKHVDNCYSIQRVLYSYTLIKWLRNFYPGKTDEEIFSRHFGGVYYVFLRGCNSGTGNGVYAQTWNSFEELTAAYNKIVREKAKG